MSRAKWSWAMGLTVWGCFGSTFANNGQPPASSMNTQTDVEGSKPTGAPRPSSNTRQESAAMAVADAAATCTSLCETYTARVATVQALNTLAENFFILWNLVGRDADFGDVETKARATAPHDSNGNAQPQPSLDDLVQQWAQAHFGSGGVEILSKASGPQPAELSPVFRSVGYAGVGVVDASCPFGSLGALGLKMCPDCIAGSGPVPPSLIPCVSAYAHSGDLVNGIVLNSGRYQRQLQTNYCQAEALFSNVAQWKASVASDVQSQASGSLAALLMFQNAIEGDSLVVSPDASSAAKQVFRSWLPYFVVPVQNAPPDALSDLNSCSN